MSWYAPNPANPQNGIQPMVMGSLVKPFRDQSLNSEFSPQPDCHGYDSSFNLLFLDPYLPRYNWIAAFAAMTNERKTIEK
jgi:hypothetical protein